MPVAAVSAYDGANVLATVTSQAKGFPPCEDMDKSLMPCFLTLSIVRHHASMPQSHVCSNILPEVRVSLCQSLTGCLLCEITYVSQ